MPSEQKIAKNIMFRIAAKNNFRIARREKVLLRIARDCSVRVSNLVGRREQFHLHGVMLSQTERLHGAGSDQFRVITGLPAGR